MAEEDTRAVLMAVRHNAVERFQNDENPFVVAVDSTRMPMIFTDARTDDDPVIYANPSFLRMTGYGLDEILGRGFGSLLASQPDQAKMTPKAIADADQNSLTASCCRKDGTAFEAALLASPVVDEGGIPKQYFISFVDLTRHLEQHLEEQARASEIYEHAPGFIAFTEGPDHRFTFANPAYEKLVGRRIPIGARVVDVLPEVVDQQFIEMLDSVYKTGEHVKGLKVPIRLQRQPDGPLETRYMNFVYQAVRNAEGETVGLFSQGSDVTEMQKSVEKLGNVEAQLIHVSRLSAMGTMAASLAHELNQPLAAIANYAAGCINILNDDSPKNEKVDQGLQAIASASLRAGRIIGKLRSMTRRSTPTSETFCLTDALREAVELVRAGGCEDVTISMQGRPVNLVRGDKIQVQQVIINLLRNACEAAAQSERRGTVFASTLAKDGLACLVVRDNGPGVSEAVKGNLFSWTDSTKPNGMGIGLSISQTIIEDLGGKIVLDETSSAGSSFSFCLPQAVEAE